MKSLWVLNFQKQCSYLIKFSLVLGVFLLFEIKQKVYWSCYVNKMEGLGG